MGSRYLEEAYRTTSYCVEVPGKEIEIRVGLHNPELNDFLARSGASQWAFVTAYNPGSQQLTTQENQLRHELLTELLKNEGYAFVPCETIDDDNEWPPEPGYVILGINQVDAEKIAQCFEQNAILFGRRDGVPELIMLIDEGSMATERRN